MQSLCVKIGVYLLILWRFEGMTMECNHSEMIYEEFHFVVYFWSDTWCAFLHDILTFTTWFCQYHNMQKLNILILLSIWQIIIWQADFFLKHKSLKLIFMFLVTSSVLLSSWMDKCRVWVPQLFFNTLNNTSIKLQFFAKQGIFQQFQFETAILHISSTTIFFAIGFLLPSMNITEHKLMYIKDVKWTTRWALKLGWYFCYSCPFSVKLRKTMNVPYSIPTKRKSTRDV